MPTERRFRLKIDTVAIETIDGKRTAITLPSGAVIKVTSGPTPVDSRMIDITWLGKQFVMFAIDLQERGVEIGAQE